MKQIPLLGLIRGLRSFYFGYIAFLIPLFLVHIGFSTIYVGIYALVATISSSVLVLLSGFMGDLYSRKKTLLLMSVLPAFIFISFLFTRNFIIISLTSQRSEYSDGINCSKKTLHISGKNNCNTRRDVGTGKYFRNYVCR